jgi:gluconokinase
MNNSGYQPWFLGIDLGTGSCKSLITDKDARILGFGSGEYAAASMHNKWQEQDPRAVMDGMIQSVRTALRQAGVFPDACEGMSIGGALHSLIALDQSGEPLTGVITWADGRAVKQAQDIRRTSLAGELYQQTGCPAHGMYPIYKLLWLQTNEPHIFQKARRFVTAKEYVFSQLTGQFLVDYGLASGSGLFNIHTHDWNAPSLDLAGISPAHLSTLADGKTTIIGLRKELADRMGLASATPVVLGSSDAANSNIGAGAVHPWQATCMIGTSGAFRVISPRPALDPESRMWCYAVDRNHWLVGGAINNGGMALAWLRDTLNQAVTLSPINEQLSFDDILDLAGQSPPGSAGLICLPFFAGERSPNWNLNAQATFFGLTLQHNINHLSRALLEGIAYRFRSIQEILYDIVGECRQVRASGGFTKSHLWLQIMADTLGQEMLVPSEGETSSLGAAIWAMHGAGVLSSLEEAADLIQIDQTVKPVPEQTKIYHQYYAIYRDLYVALKPHFDQIVRARKEKAF